MGVYLSMMIFAALLTPGGDFFSLPLTTAILYGLYELAILIGSRIEAKREHHPDQVQKVLEA